jgi:sec-independent protein translocase protein TatA
MGFIAAPGPLEIVVILVVALLVLGPQRLPEVARSVGKGMREFKDSLQGIGDDDDDRYAADELVEDSVEEDDRPTARPVT